MQIVKALAQECVRNKQWNDAFVAALKELGVDVEIPVNDAAKYAAAHKEDAVVDTATMLPVDLAVPGSSTAGIGINPASNLPKGSDLIGVECYVWGTCRESDNSTTHSSYNLYEQRRKQVTLTAYHPERGYSWGTEMHWFDNAVPVWFGEPNDYVEVTEGLMVEKKHQLWVDYRSGVNGHWDVVFGLAGLPVREDECPRIVRARRDGRDF